MKGPTESVALRFEAHKDYDAVEVLLLVQRTLEAAGFRFRDLGTGANGERIAVVTPPDGACARVQR